MDVLSDILASVSMKFSMIGTVRLSEPVALQWFGAHPDEPTATCLSLVEGEPLWLSDRSRVRLQMKAGDTLFLTKDADIVLSSHGEAEPANIPFIWEKLGLPPPSLDNRQPAPVRIKWGGGGRESLLLVLAFGMDGGQEHPLVGALPAVSLLRAEEGHFSPWIAPATEFLALEEHSAQPGFAVTARVLAELIFVSYVRTLVLRTDTAPIGWLKGLTDQRLARALAALHRNPANQWTVASLAEVACMSRSSFALRFADLVGQSPIEYLTSWRVYLARQRLKEGNCKVARLAEELGYTSEAVFRQTFKRHTGVSPSRFAADR
ncbi:MAG: AraC family transcriptional regulator [Desulfuromonadaceae bacterium]|nr:AraC family transcriptional regulator [Desulfuromonadaceae bacterium]